MWHSHTIVSTLMTPLGGVGVDSQCPGEAHGAQNTKITQVQSCGDESLAQAWVLSAAPHLSPTSYIDTLIKGARCVGTQSIRNPTPVQQRPDQRGRQTQSSFHKRKGDPSSQGGHSSGELIFPTAEWERELIDLIEPEL